jgi:hypothetical protein
LGFSRLTPGAGGGCDVRRGVGFGARALQDDGAGTMSRMSQDAAAVENG